MSASLLYLLLKLTIATSLGIAIVGALRKPLRLGAGSKAAYVLWLLIPVSAVATLFPSPMGPVGMVSLPLPDADAFAKLIVVPAATGRTVSLNYPTLIASIWVMGVAANLAFVVVRQWAFRRRLGPLIPGPDGLCRSPAASGPMLVGLLHSRIVLPANFDSQYTPDERALVLAHEYTHRSRKDNLTNAFALIVVCFFWFNPLMYWAYARFRFDQELVCDAEVLSRPSAKRDCYAEALLKTQIAGDSVWSRPVGCHWQPIHPLKERVAMLKRPAAGWFRRKVGVGIAAAVTGLVGYAAWATQPERLMPAVSGQPIAIHMKWEIQEVDDGAGPASLRKIDSTTDMVASVGQEFSLYAPSSTNKIHEASCIAYLPGDTRIANQLALDKIHFHKGIFLKCALKSHGRLLSRPSLITADGETADIEYGQGMPVQYSDHHAIAEKVLFLLHINASTTSARVAAANEAQAKLRSATGN